MTYVRGEFGIFPVLDGAELRYQIRWLRTGEWMEDGCAWTSDRDMAMRFDWLAAVIALDAVDCQLELFEAAHDLGVCNECI
jgi:hypothetical protein